MSGGTSASFLFGQLWTIAEAKEGCEMDSHKSITILSVRLIVSAMFVTAFAWAQFSSAASIPPPPALPPAGGVFSDLVHGTPIMRVTDANDGASAFTAYSNWPTFNSNSTRLEVLVNQAAGSDSSVPMLYDFDPVNFRLGNKQPLFAHPSPSGHFPFWEDSIWSGSDPDVIYGHEGPRLWAYNVASKSYDLVKDFTSALPANSDIWEMSKSRDDQTFAFTVRDLSNPSAGVRAGYGAWSRTQDAMLINQGLPVQGLDEVQIDKSGRYLVVKTSAQGAGTISAMVIDMQKNTTESLTDDTPDFAPGHSDNGQGSLVGAENWENRILLRNLDTPHQFQTVLLLGQDWSQGYHISMIADDESQALVSFFTANNLLQTGPCNDQIVLVSTDGSGQVHPLAYHYSIHNGYWDSPRANISLDGQFAAFTSNWGDSGRQDVFVLHVPEPSSIELVGLALLMLLTTSVFRKL